ncbi:MAG: AbrB/MazE/SpoVT family DNA-binding domain-containing protein [Synergistes sp.]|nr:AbrB/MazE/SpoVT family DNA-binding domain-containing protein [Synergistes sp.]
MKTQLLTVSAKGQISLPAAMRRNLAISEGDKLAAYTKGKFIILKLVTLPTARELEEQLDRELKEEYEMTDDEILVGKFVKEFRKKRRNKACES